MHFEMTSHDMFTLMEDLGVGNMLVTKLNYVHDTCLVPLLPGSSNKHLYMVWS